LLMSLLMNCSERTMPLAWMTVLNFYTAWLLNLASIKASSSSCMNFPLEMLFSIDRRLVTF